MTKKELTEAFCNAVSDGDLKQAKLLLKQGANPNLYPSDWTGPPIELAVNNGDEKMVKWLLELKVKEPKSLLGSVAYATRDDKFVWLFQQLIAKGADVNYTNVVNVPPICLVHDTELLSLLLKKGAKVDYRDNEGATPLHWAARGAPKEIIDMLLANGAKLEAKDKRNKTPLHYAKEGGVYNKHTVEYLQKLLGTSESTGSWNKVEAELFKRSKKAIDSFAKKHSKDTFDRFLFDCNAAYGDVHLYFHTTTEGESSWQKGDWKYPAFAELELDLSDLENDKPGPFMEAVCRTLMLLEKQVFKSLRCSSLFETLALDHDETIATAKKRLKKVRDGGKK